MTRSTAGLLSLVALLGALLHAPAAHADYIDHFADREDIGVMKVPHTGVTRVLVLPVVIEDLPFENPQKNEEEFLEDTRGFFAPDAPGWSFTNYYDTASVGRFHPEATVAAPIRFPSCPTLGGFSDCAIPRGAGFSEDPSGAIETMHDALKFLDEILRCAQLGPGAGRACTSGGGVDLADFDTSGPIAGEPDGVVDGVILLSNAGFPGIALPVKDLSGNQILNFLGAVPSFTYEGKTVGAIAISGAEGFGGEKATFVSVHEFGHLLGFADLYNEDGSATDMPYSLMGGWFYDTAGSLLDPFSRIAIGWGHVVQVSESATITLTPAETTGMVLKLGTGDEFFLAELRRKSPGLVDEDMSVDFGVLLQRVQLAKRPSPVPGDYFETLQDCVNCTPFDAMLQIEEADGGYDLQKGDSRDDAGDLLGAGDFIGPSGDEEPRGLDHAVFSTNLLSGEQTGINFRVVSVSRDQAVVEVGVRAVADGCAEIEDFCGDFPCEDGVCGAPPPEPEPPAEVPVCGCSSSSSESLPNTAALLCAAALAWFTARSAKARRRPT